MNSPKLTILLSGLAGGMAWGIRGQYGHETGAMMFGVLVGLLLLMRHGAALPSITAARAVALMAVGVSFGGSMTYGQTLGLTHDAALVGNGAALGWGLFGCFLKGGIWIGFAGLFLGMGLSAKRYQAWEMAIMLVGATLLLLLGCALLNQPFDPANRQLPKIYFSDHWKWEPDAENLKPRRERWGGLLLALIGMVVYVRWRKHDVLACRLALWGCLAGGLGFAGGQALQAAHAWYPTVFDKGMLEPVTRHVNWWNLMETTFGFVAGTVLAMGFLRHRPLITTQKDPLLASIPWWVEGLLLAAHLTALITWNFLSVDALDAVADLAIPMGILPVIGILSGRWWPYWMALPVVAAPIAGKTLRELAYKTNQVSEPSGILVYVALPLVAMILVACLQAKTPRHASRAFTASGLLLAVWVYFGLNWAFFEYPWPWEPWTGRTPHGLVYAVCAVALTMAGVRALKSPPADEPCSQT